MANYGSIKTLRRVFSICAVGCISWFARGQEGAATASSLIPIPQPSLDGASPEVKSHIEEEKKLWETAIHANDSSASAKIALAYGRLARVYHTYQFEDAALACYRNADTLQPDIYPRLYLIGLIYQKKGKYKEALEYYTRANNLAEGIPQTPPPVKVALYCGMGDIYLKLDRTLDAMEAFQRAIEFNPRCAFAWQGLGLVYSMEDNSPATLECLERAVALQPRASAAKVLLAGEYRKAGMTAKAGQTLPKLSDQKAIPVTYPDPIYSQNVAPLNRSVNLMQRRGVRALHRGNYPLAAALFEKMLETDPGLEKAKANLAGVYMNMGRLDQAEVILNDLLESEPDKASYHVLLGDYCMKKREFVRAFHAFEKAAALEPEVAGHLYRIGASLSWQGKYPEALAMYENTLTLNESDSDAWVGATIMLGRLGRYEDALKRLDRCVELFPESTLARLHLARLLAACPERTIRDGRRALDVILPLYEKQKSILRAETVAMACAEIGEFNRAVKVQEWAIEAGANGRREDLARLQRNLSLYQSRQPCREPWGKDEGFPFIDGMVSGSVEPQSQEQIGEK